MKALKVTITIVKNGIEGYVCTCDYPFKHFDFLNITKVAKYAEMSPSNFRHYAVGSKKMSQNQFSKVKQAFNRMADELKACTLTM